MIFSLRILKIIFIEITLVNNIMQISGVKLYDTTSVYSIVCSPHEVYSSSITIYSTCFLSSSSSPHPACDVFKETTSLLLKDNIVLNKRHWVPLVFFQRHSNILQSWDERKQYIYISHVYIHGILSLDRGILSLWNSLENLQVTLPEFCSRAVGSYTFLGYQHFWYFYENVNTLPRKISTHL